MMSSISFAGIWGYLRPSFIFWRPDAMAGCEHRRTEARWVTGEQEREMGQSDNGADVRPGTRAVGVRSGGLRWM